MRSSPWTERESPPAHCARSSRRRSRAGGPRAPLSTHRSPRGRCRARHEDRAELRHRAEAGAHGAPVRDHEELAEREIAGRARGTDPASIVAVHTDDPSGLGGSCRRWRTAAAAQLRALVRDPFFFLTGAALLLKSFMAVLLINNPDHSVLDTRLSPLVRVLGPDLRLVHRHPAFARAAGQRQVAARVLPGPRRRVLSADDRRPLVLPGVQHLPLVHAVAADGEPLGPLGQHPLDVAPHRPALPRGPRRVGAGWFSCWRGLYRDARRALAAAALVPVAAVACLAWEHHAIDVTGTDENHQFLEPRWEARETISFQSPLGFHVLDVWNVFLQNRAVVAFAGPGRGDQGLVRRQARAAPGQPVQGHPQGAQPDRRAGGVAGEVRHRPFRRRPADHAHARRAAPEQPLLHEHPRAGQRGIQLGLRPDDEHLGLPGAEGLDVLPLSGQRVQLPAAHPARGGVPHDRRDAPRPGGLLELEERADGHRVRHLPRREQLRDPRDPRARDFRRGFPLPGGGEDRGAPRAVLRRSWSRSPPTRRSTCPRSTAS